MKKKVILLSILLVAIVVCFIPVTQQKTITVKAPFLNIYRLLDNPSKWKKWRADLRNISPADSGKISIQKDSAAFKIKYDSLEVNVRSGGDAFVINERSGKKSIDYNYIVLPDKLPTKTLITVNKENNVVSYLLGKIGADPFSDTHITDLKNFMENDSLLYGCKIFKTRVSESNLIVIKTAVLTKNKFTQAAKQLADLQQYVKIHNLKQMQPMIAQFLPIGKDSTQIKVGLYIDKEVPSDNQITFTRMPKGGPLYVAHFKGRFDQRQNTYAGIHEYFVDHLYQLAILPFETYLDNKLPTADTDIINIQVNFATFF